VTKIKADEIGRSYRTYRVIKGTTEGIIQKLKIKDHCGQVGAKCRIMLWDICRE
jgi:hypothetical protein